MTDRDTDTLARTLWGEARSEGEIGMRAVACVVLNRVAAKKWWGSTVYQVCRKPWQFSCWNSNDPNLRKMLSVTIDDPSFSLATHIAIDALAGRITDFTRGATNYKRIGTPARWAQGLTPCFIHRNHEFYNNVS